MQTIAQQRAVLVTRALQCLGKPFRYGATAEESPEHFDCSGLVQYLYRMIGIELPRRAIDQAVCGKVVTMNTLKVGDLLFFHGTVGHYNPDFPQGIGHVAMFVGDEGVIQATGKDGKVVVATIDDIMARGDLVVIKRVLGTATLRSRIRKWLR